MSASNELSKDVGVMSSSIVTEDAATVLSRIRGQLPSLADKLKRLGITTVVIEYDGGLKSGKIEDIVCLDRDQNRIKLTGKTPATDSELADLFHDLIDARYPYWANGDGAYGESAWDLNADSLNHTRNQRFTEYHTTEHEGV